MTQQPHISKPEMRSLDLYQRIRNTIRNGLVIKYGMVGEGWGGGTAEFEKLQQPNRDDKTQKVEYVK